MIIAEMITIVFLILKFTAVITWSWWWIFSPLLIVYGGLLSFIIIWIVFAGGLISLVNGIDKISDFKLKRRRGK